MLDKMGNNSSSLFNARQGTYIIGIVMLLSSATSLYIAKTFSRRFLFVYGHIAIGIAHISVGLFAYLNQPFLALFSMCMFIIFYQNSSGCITWLYFSEIAVDVIIGLVGFFGYLIVFILSVITPFILDKNNLGPTNTFIMFGLISFLAAIWTYFYIKETMGLNDK